MKSLLITILVCALGIWGAVSYVKHEEKEKMKQLVHQRQRQEVRQRAYDRLDSMESAVFFRRLDLEHEKFMMEINKHRLPNNKK